MFLRENNIVHRYSYDPNTSKISHSVYKVKMINKNIILFNKDLAITRCSYGNIFINQNGIHCMHKSEKIAKKKLYKKLKYFIGK